MERFMITVIIDPVSNIHCYDWVEDKGCKFFDKVKCSCPLFGKMSARPDKVKRHYKCVMDVINKCKK